MRYRRLIAALTTFSVCCCISAAAATRIPQRLRFGLEWGYTGTIYERHHYNFLSEAGSRLNIKDGGYLFNSNGHLLAYAGVELGKHWEADIFSGTAGIIQDRRVIPLSLRATYFRNGCRNDGFKLFADSGVCFIGSFNDSINPIGKAGIGYRLMLTSRSSLDIAFSAQYAYDHPEDVYVSEMHYSVPVEDLLKSERRYIGLNISLSLNF